MTIDRASLLAVEAQLPRSLRAVPTTFQLRDAGDGADGRVAFEGYASITGHGYDVYGGPPYGWTEIIAPGAFRKTLSENPAVKLLVNHEGKAIASTKAETLKLNEDEQGLFVRAGLNPARTDANDVIIAMRDRDVDEMSFAFRIIRQRWEDEDGNEVDMMTAPVRRILEVSLDKGDVSIVNFGANDATFGGVDRALAELRSAGAITADQRAALASIIGVDVRTVPVETPPETPAASKSVAELRANAAPATYRRKQHPAA